jgi:hypothetical protein
MHEDLGGLEHRNGPACLELAAITLARVKAPRPRPANGAGEARAKTGPPSLWNVVFTEPAIRNVVSEVVWTNFGAR